MIVISAVDRGEWVFSSGSHADAFWCKKRANPNPTPRQDAFRGRFTATRKMLILKSLIRSYHKGESILTCVR